MKSTPTPGLEKTLGKLTGKEPVTLVALGDSNTELTWHTAGRLNWVGLLQEALFERHGANLVTMINAGRCGDTAQRACDRIERDVVRFRPNLVIVSFSMNDAFQGRAGLAAFSDAIRRLVHELREKCGCEVLLRTTNPVVVMNQPGLPKGHVAGEEPPGLAHGLYAARLVKLGRELQCPVVDHYALWKGAKRRKDWGQDPNHLWMRMSDATHPNALGHLCFFRELAPLFGLPARFPWEE